MNDLDNFISEIWSETRPFNDRPRHKNERWWNDTVHLEVIADRHAGFAKVNLGFIAVYYPNQGKGYASECLRWLLSVADKHNVHIVGWADPVGSLGLKKTELKRWYRRYGFNFDRHSNGLRVPVEGMEVQS